MAKKLRIFESMGSALGVGWERDDHPMIHLFALAEPGEVFQPSVLGGGPHWPCEVCDEHGYTEQDFHGQIIEALNKGPKGNDSCCSNENRNINGGCDSCGDPAL